MTDSELETLVSVFFEDCGALGPKLVDIPLGVETCHELLTGALVLRAMERIAKSMWGRKVSLEEKEH